MASLLSGPVCPLSSPTRENRHTGGERDTDRQTDREMVAEMEFLATVILAFILF